MTKHQYPITIKETNLDSYGHVNNASYFVFFEEARWEFITANDYGHDKILKFGHGPVILEASIKYLKELRLRDQIVIETRIEPYKSIVAKIHQKMMRGDEVCCTAEFSVGLFDFKTRKLVKPTKEWLKALGLDH